MMFELVLRDGLWRVWILLVGIFMIGFAVEGKH